MTFKSVVRTKKHLKGGLKWWSGFSPDDPDCGVDSGCIVRRGMQSAFFCRSFRVSARASNPKKLACRSWASPGAQGLVGSTRELGPEPRKWNRSALFPVWAPGPPPEVRWLGWMPGLTTEPEDMVGAYGWSHRRPWTYNIVLHDSLLVVPCLRPISEETIGVQHSSPKAQQHLEDAMARANSRFLHAASIAGWEV